MKADDDAHEFEALLQYVKATRGFDFSSYKRATLTRRIAKRMREVGVEGYANYSGYLEIHDEEFDRLFNAILINITAFFRDAPAWQYLSNEVVPRILTEKGAGGEVRVWSAGCASGEEPYTLAMLLADALGLDAYRRRVKIYATDIDEEALAAARLGLYREKDIDDVPHELAARYLERAGDRYAVSKELRRSVIFGRHDLMQDPPISRIDLLVSRNTLMYFTADAQARILARFYFALNDTGYLFLGRAETLFTHTETFTPAELSFRVFRRVPRANLGDRALLMAQSGSHEAARQLANHVRIQDVAFETDPLTHLIVDAAGRVALINQKAREMFGLSPGDVGRPLQDLEVSYRPLELRSAIERVSTEGTPATFKDVAYPTISGEERWLDVTLAPLQDNGAPLLGVDISFADVTRARTLHEALERSRNDLETAYEELQSTNEELETTNEELQSTVEELETTNEELQSTNEELETMNEELASTNDELGRVNDEIQRSGTLMSRANGLLESVVARLGVGVVVVDTSLNVRAWNETAAELWGVRAEEAQGRNIAGLDIGLPVEQLINPIRDCLVDGATEREQVVGATNRRGKAFRCRIRLSALRAGDGDGDGDGEISGVILLMEDLRPQEPAKQ